MENRTNSYIGITIFLLIITLSSALWLISSRSEPVGDNPLTPEPSPSSLVVVKDELRDVNFCGNTYKVKQVKIDGVDVVQRIAELITRSQLEHEKDVCNIAESLQRNGWLRLGENENEIAISEAVNNTGAQNKIYKISLGSPTGNFHIKDFQIDITTGDIWIILYGFDGSSNKLVGKLK